MNRRHPFEAGTFGGGNMTYWVDAPSRMLKVKDLIDAEDIEGLRLVLEVEAGTPLQQSVRKRAESALRRLMKEQAST